MCVVKDPQPSILNYHGSEIFHVDVHLEANFFNFAFQRGVQADVSWFVKNGFV